MTEKEVEPYDRQPGESQQAFAAFVHYRDMGPARSVDAAYRASSARRKRSKRADGTWSRWSAKNDWTERALAYDSHLDSLKRKERERAAVEEHRKGIQAYQKRQQELAEKNIEATIGLLEKAGARLELVKPKEIEVKDLPAFFRAAAAVAEQASNAEAQSLAIGELLAELIQE